MATLIERLLDFVDTMTTRLGTLGWKPGRAQYESARNRIREAADELTRLSAALTRAESEIAEARKTQIGASAAITDVLAERRRQIEAEGWTPGHDDKHSDGALAKAATCYASVFPLAPSYWPWDLSWWKPSTNRRRNLVKAGALIIAEIDRLDRSAVTSRALEALTNGGA